MASIHHLIGWHAWLLPSSPWQCECPPSSHHHGNGSVPQQPSAWAECKPLNQDHHGNMCLLKHQAAVCLGVCVCVCVCAQQWYQPYHKVLPNEMFSVYLSLYFSSKFFTFHCILILVGGWVPQCRPCPKWGPAGGLNGTDRASVHPNRCWILWAPLGAHHPCLLGTSSSVSVLTHNSESWQNHRGWI